MTPVDPPRRGRAGAARGSRSPARAGSPRPRRSRGCSAPVTPAVSALAVTPAVAGATGAVAGAGLGAMAVPVAGLRPLAGFWPVAGLWPMAGGAGGGGAAATVCVSVTVTGSVTVLVTVSVTVRAAAFACCAACRAASVSVRTRPPTVTVRSTAAWSGPRAVVVTVSTESTWPVLPAARTHAGKQPQHQTCQTTRDGDRKPCWVYTHRASSPLPLPAYARHITPPGRGRKERSLTRGLTHGIGACSI